MGRQPQQHTGISGAATRGAAQTAPTLLEQQLLLIPSPSKPNSSPCLGEESLLQTQSCCSEQFRLFSDAPAPQSLAGCGRNEKKHDFEFQSPEVAASPSLPASCLQIQSSPEARELIACSGRQGRFTGSSPPLAGPELAGSVPRVVSRVRGRADNSLTLCSSSSHSIL